MPVVLADTSGLYAMLDADDKSHASAVSAWTRLLTSEEPILVHHFVAVELWSLVQSRLGLDAVAELLRNHWPFLTLHPISEDLFARAIARCLGARRRELSLTDCASFEFALDHGLRHAFAFDRHFHEAGLTLPDDPGWLEG